MGVRPLIMERCIPSKLFQWNVHRPRHVHRIGRKQRLPFLRIIESKPRGILPAQRDDRQPDRARMVCNFLLHFGQHQGIFAAGEQAVGAETLCAGTFGNVVQIIFFLGDLVQVVLNRTRDELGRITLSGRLYVVCVLVQALAQRKLTHQFFNHVDLLFSRRQVHVTRINVLDALACGDILHHVSQVRSGL